MIKTCLLRSLCFFAVNQLQLFGIRVRPFLSVALFAFLVSFVANTHASGSWLVDGQIVQTPTADPDAIYIDGTRHMEAPLCFAPSVANPYSKLFRAYIPWTEAYADIFILDEDEEVLWLSTSQNINFGVGSLFISSTQLTSLSYGGSINFEERSLGGGGWILTTVENSSYAILNRTYADTRYIQRSEGITVNHTIQAGDILQIQNGIITAINP